MTGLALVEILGGWRATVFAALLLLASVVAGVQSWRYDRAATRAGEWAQVAAAFQSTNAQNVETIVQLKQANDAWAGAAQAQEKEAAEAVETVARERDALAAEIESLRRERGQIYATDPTAAAWGRTRVPARIVQQLRQ